MCGPDRCRGCCDGERHNDHCCGGQRGKLRGVCQRSAFLGCVVGTNFVLAIVALVVGIVFASLLGQRGRESYLAVFNDASAKWPAAARAFRNLTAGAAGGALTVTGDGGTITLQPFFGFYDTYPDVEGLDVPSRADTFKYFEYQAGPAPIAPRIAFADGEFVALAVNVSGVTSGSKAPIFRANAVGSGRSSSVNGVTKSICIVVSPTTSTVAGACNFDRESRIAVSAFKAAGSGPWDFAGLPISVRSSEDPYYVLL